MRENAWGKDIYLALRLCATEQRKSSKSHFYYSSESYGQTYEILVHPSVICSTAFPLLTLQPTEYKQGKVDFQKYKHWPADRTGNPRKGCMLPKCSQNSFISAWVADSRDLRQKDTLELESVNAQVNQVKEEVSLQNLSHRLAFTVTFSCIKHNGETQHEK